MRLAPEGRIIVLPLFLLTGLILYLTVSMGTSFTLVGFAFGLLVFCLNFFRDPVRNVPAGKNLLLAPSDGKIFNFIEVDDPEFGESQLVSIFRMVFIA